MLPSAGNCPRWPACCLQSPVAPPQRTQIPTALTLPFLLGTSTQVRNSGPSCGLKGLDEQEIGENCTKFLVLGSDDRWFSLSWKEEVFPACTGALGHRDSLQSWDPLSSARHGSKFDTMYSFRNHWLEYLYFNDVI